MHRPEVTHLYKYRPSLEFVDALIGRGELWAAHPSTLNDPSECTFPDYSCTDLFRGFFSLMEDSKVRDPKQLGVTSLSETADCELMWAHYAANHTGYCLEYARDTNSLFCGDRCRPIDYVESYEPIADPWVRLLRKSAAWSYEKEWRVLSAAYNESIPAKPTGIILGLRSSTELGTELRDLAAEAGNLRVGKLQQAEGSFEFRVNWNSID